MGPPHFWHWKNTVVSAFIPESCSAGLFVRTLGKLR